MAPSYAAPFPRLIGARNLEPAAYSAMENTWRAGHFPGQEFRLLRFDEAYVTAEGLAFGLDLEPIAETITQHSPAEIDASRQRIRASLQSGEELDHQIDLALCYKRGATNYGHWLIEMVSRVALMAEACPGYTLGLPALEGQLAQVAMRSTELVAGAARRVYLRFDHVTKVSGLLVADGLSVHGCYLSPLAVEATRRLDASLKIRPRNANLYVSRSRLAYRRLTNEDQVVAALAAEGFITVYPEEMTLDQQIDLFGHAACIVGVMGAAMTNVVFCPTGASVINIAPGGMPDTFFWLLCAIRKLDYTEIRCPPGEAGGGVMPWDGDIHVAPILLNQVIEAARARARARASPQY